MPMKPDIFFEHMKGLIGLVFKMAEDRIEAFCPLHSTVARSRRAVAFASHIQFKGVSEEELTDILLSSMDVVADFCQKTNK